jgi:hypothetical protein
MGLSSLCLWGCLAWALWCLALTFGWRWERWPEGFLVLLLAEVVDLSQLSSEIVAVNFESLAKFHFVNNFSQKMLKKILSLKC